MHTKETTYKKPFIEKFKGKFKEIDGGGTIAFTKIIQSIKNQSNLAVYIYLASKPAEWKINAKELQLHFDVGIKKIYRSLSDLATMGLIERKEIRDKGKFLDYEYYLHLSPKGQNGKTVSPNGQKPLGGEPIGHFGLTYKEKSSCIENIESKKDFLKEKSLGLLFDTSATLAGSKLNTPANSAETPAKIDHDTGHHGRDTKNSTNPSSKGILSLKSLNHLETKELEFCIKMNVPLSYEFKYLQPLLDEVLELENI